MKNMFLMGAFLGGISFIANANAVNTSQLDAQINAVCDDIDQKNTTKTPAYVRALRQEAAFRVVTERQALNHQIRRKVPLKPPYYNSKTPILMETPTPFTLISKTTESKGAESAENEE